MFHIQKDNALTANGRVSTIGLVFNYLIKAAARLACFNYRLIFPSFSWTMASIADIRQLLKEQKEDLLAEIDKRLDDRITAKLEESNKVHATRVENCEAAIAQLEDYNRVDNIIVHNFPLNLAADFASVTGQVSKEDVTTLWKGMSNFFDFLGGRAFTKETGPSVLCIVYQRGHDRMVLRHSIHLW